MLAKVSQLRLNVDTQALCESLATHIRIVVHDGRRVLALKIDQAHLPETWGGTDANELALPHSILLKSRSNLRHGVKLPKSVALFPSDPGTFCGIYGQPLLLHLISHRIWNGRLAPDRLPKRNQV